MSEEMKEANKAFEKIRDDFQNPVFQSIGKIWYHLKMVERMEKKEPLLERISEYMNFLAIEAFFMLAGFLVPKHSLLLWLCGLICVIFGAFLLGNIKSQAKKYKYIEKKAKEVGGE